MSTFVLHGLQSTETCQKVNYAGINYSKDDESISPSNISAKEAAEAEEFFSTKFVTENP